MQEITINLHPFAAQCIQSSVDRRVNTFTQRVSFSLCFLLRLILCCHKDCVRILTLHIAPLRLPSCSDVLVEVCDVLTSRFITRSMLPFQCSFPFPVPNSLFAVVASLGQEWRWVACCSGGPGPSFCVWVFGAIAMGSAGEGTQEEVQENSKRTEDNRPHRPKSNNGTSQSRRASWLLLGTWRRATAVAKPTEKGRKKRGPPT